ncbi:NADH-cytochrome b5 reductase [Entomortierella beljakovae]|nr:NADH-cytochrome b5 reductase [Entomortierella beljakovae]
MTLSNTGMIAASGIILAGSFLVDPETVPFVAAGVAATWAGFFYKKSSRAPPMDPKEYRKFKLVERTVLSHNTGMYKFALPHADDTLNLPIGQHISIMANINGKDISRSYTPTSSSDDRGSFTLCIKTYPQGNISKYIWDLKVGETINVRGPKGQFNYTPNMCRAIGMIAGGTGLTPMYQIIYAILKNPDDKTLINFLFANVNEEDILLKEELDGLAKKYPQFKIHYVLNVPPSGWTGETGFVSGEMIKKYMPEPASDIKVLLCGPPPMITAMSKITQEMGYDKVNAVSKLPDQIFKF